MKKLATLLLGLTLLIPPVQAGVLMGEEDGTPNHTSTACWAIKVANGNLTPNSDGTCSLADQGGAGAGDNVTVNSVATDTTANLKDTATVTWALTDGGAGGPDDAEASIVNNASNTEVQYNASGVLDGDATLTYLPASSELTLLGPNATLAQMPRMNYGFTGDADYSISYLNYAHDNIAISFDSYHNGTSWISSYPSGNFAIYKNGGLLKIGYATGYAAGTSFGGFNLSDGVTFGKTGTMSIGRAPISTVKLALQPNNTTHVPLAVFGASGQTGNLTQWQDSTSAVLSSVNKDGEFRAPDGLKTSPGYSFGSDTDTGIYRASGNVLGFSTAGVTRLMIQADQLRGPAGSEALPSYASFGDPDTGLRIVGGNVLALSNGGTETARMTTTGFDLSGVNLKLDASQYMNFGATFGTTGYGIRDNAGTIECKDSGGSWSACQDGGGSVEGTAVLSTGEVGGTKFLREDGDGTSSWQTVTGSSEWTDTGTFLEPNTDGDGTQLNNSGLLFNNTVAGDTDYWIKPTSDSGGDEDDVLQIGEGTTPGSGALIHIRDDASGDAYMKIGGDVSQAGVTSASLHVVYEGNTGPGVNPRGILSAVHDDTSHSAHITTRKSGGTEASPTAVTNGEFFGGFTTEAYDGAAYERAGFLAWQSTAVSGNNITSKAVLAVDEAGTEQYRFEFLEGGTFVVDAGFDGDGAVDLDYGSADITDHTFITDGGQVIILDDSTNTVGLSMSGDRIFHDTDADGVKDAGEEFIDASGGASFTDIDTDYGAETVTSDWTLNIVSGKQDRNDTAIDDDSCVGEQGSWWYDTTDSAFEFCNLNSGAPTVLGGGTFTDIDTDYGNETVTATWTINDVGTGDYGEEDLTIGGSDYGVLLIGNGVEISDSVHESGASLDLQDAMVFRNYNSPLDVANDPGIEFVFTEGITNDIRMAIPEGAAGNATAMIRSVTMAGPDPVTQTNDIVTCDYWSSYDSNIDCDTSGTGADLFVQDDIELEGELFLSGTNIVHFESDDANSIQLTSSNATADRTITLPDETGTVITTGASAGILPDDSILEADLKAVDAPSDEECLTYETTTGDFEWQTCGGGGGGGGITNLNLPVQSAKITGSFVTDGDATQGAGIDAGDGNWRLLFDATTDEGAVWQFVMPDNYSSSPKLDVHFSMASGEANEVEFEGAIMCYTSGTDTADVGTASFSAIAVGTATTVSATAGEVYLQSVTLTDDSCAASDMVWIYLSTDADDATNDDATGDREVIGVEFNYTGA